MTHDERVEAYNRERDVAVLGPLGAFELFAAKYGRRFTIPGAAQIAQHKLRTAINATPDDVRAVSKAWLLERGFTSWD